MAVVYEWDAEEVDWNGDRVDHNFGKSYKDVLKWSKSFNPKQGNHFEIVLVRDQYDTSDTDQLIDRTWAYMENGKLPEMFDNGVKVPERFHKEVERTKNS